MRKSRVLALGLLLVLIGGLLAWQTQTDGGQIDIKDVRFVGTNGLLMSGLLYVPPGATAETPAPAVLAIHGYINSRETQAPYAIEFARRGYVVLALDQSGHGYSEPPAFANGFGGIDGLAYLRSLDIVDKDNIGLEGHSMGGWAVAIAAAVIPDGYKSINLQGSSTGTFGAPDGTAEFPRNFALTFSTWDEFSELMWGSPTGKAIVDTAKLQTAFNTDAPVVVEQLYGSIEDGTARVLYQPVTTHPGDHLNSSAVASAIDWMQKTLTGGNGLDQNNQVWQNNEVGRLIALVGMVISMVAFGGLLLETGFFSGLAHAPAAPKPTTGTMRYIGYALIMFVPIISFFWLNNQGAQLVPAATALFAQNITTGVMVWALGNALISLVLFLLWHFTSNASNNPTLATYGLSVNVMAILKALLFAVCVVGFGYFLLVLSDLLFKSDFRFWVVAVKLMSSLHFRIFLSYLPFFTVFFLMLGVALHGQHRPEGAVSLSREIIGNVGLLVLGFFVLLLVQYVPLLTGGTLPIAEPLLTIVAFQFIPLLTIAGVIMTYFYRKTGTIFAGAFTSSILITWIIVASTATHYPF
ncbi:MAG: alpha/beta fold hydrolase [Chloroflexi bacterium]|nr:alpha/beta fold hydrolase [Chloroflexota bacterium]